MRLVSNSLKSNVIRTLFFSIQFLFRIMSLEIDPIYMIICYCLFRVLSWPSIHFLRIIFSFVTVLTSVSYLAGMVFNPFLCIHVFDITVILVPESISLILVTALSSSSLIITRRVIRVLSPSSSPFLGPPRFLTCWRLREWSSFVWPYKIVWYSPLFCTWNNFVFSFFLIWSHQFL